MPFELSDTIKNTCQLSLHSQGLNLIFCNKFYTTAILTFVIIILIMIIYPCKEGTKSLVLCKLCLYIFLASLAIICVHDGVLYKDNIEKIGGDKSDEFINRISGGEDIVYGGDSIPVTPDVNRGNTEREAEAVTSGGSEDIFTMYGL